MNATLLGNLTATVWVTFSKIDEETCLPEAMRHMKDAGNCTAYDVLPLGSAVINLLTTRLDMAESGLFAAL